MLKQSRPMGSGAQLKSKVATGVLAALLCHHAALAAPVRGKIAGAEKLVSETYSEAAKVESHRFVWREPSPTVRSEFRTLGPMPGRDICIAAIASAASGPQPPVPVNVTGGRTSQGTIVVSPGTRIAFRNVDPFPHRLFQVDDPKWAAEPIAAMSSREWTAPGPGKYEIRDELFPSVRMFVVVDAQAVKVAYPDASGAFSIDVPEGTYTLRAYYEGRQVGREVAGVHVGAFPSPVELREPLAVGGDAK